MAQIISNLSFFLAIFVLIKLLEIDKRSKFSYLMLTLIFIFPTSFYFTAAYNDSLFLLFASLCLYFSAKRHWLRSSFFGGLATLTRLNGLVLIFVVFFDYIHDKIDIKKLLSGKITFKKLISSLKESFNLVKIIKGKIYAVLLIPLGFLSYLFYVQVQFNDWQKVFSSMKVWNQDKVILLPQVFWRYFKIIILHPTFQLNFWVAVMEVTFVIFYFNSLLL